MIGRLRRARAGLRWFEASLHGCCFFLRCCCVVRSGARGRIALRVFCTREAITAAVNFLDIAAALELLDHARQITAATMLQVHAMRDLADAGGLRERREVSGHLFRSDFGRM